MIWRWIARPVFFSFPAEGAHHAAMSVFNAAMFPPMTWIAESILRVKDPRLQQDLLGMTFENPLGLAAGFDKQAQWFNALYRLGFSHVEIGTITGERQGGNPKPRLFRLARDRALINRMGFNNPGCESVATRLSRSIMRPILGVNIGKTKIVDNAHASADYLKSFNALFDYASYFTINVSSPNTPGLRELQDREPLERLLNAVLRQNQLVSSEKRAARKPILLKIAPDLTNHQLDEVVEIAVSAGIDGLIATNTTISRERLKTAKAKLESIGAGGLSGSPLTERSREVVAHLYRQLQGRLTIIGSGGVMSGDDVWQLITAGASLVQVYTGFVYGGPYFVRKLNRYILRKLQTHGLVHVEQAIGLYHR